MVTTGDEDWAISETEGRIVPKWLWVLGWICIFPLPLTIIILRKKDIKQELKYGIIVIAWVAYVLLALFADNDKDADSTPDAVSWHKENVQVECLRDEPEEDESKEDEPKKDESKEEYKVYYQNDNGAVLEEIFLPISFV